MNREWRSDPDAETILRDIATLPYIVSTKEERIEHAVYLVRQFGMHVDTVARAMIVSNSTITDRIRAEDERANLAKQGIDSSGLPRCSLGSLAGIADESTKLHIAKIAVAKRATGDAIADVAKAVSKAKSKAAASSVIAEFSKNLDTIAAIKGTTGRKGLKKPRREKFLSMLTNLSHFLENGNDGDSFSTLDELSCSVIHDLDSVRVMAARINGRLQCICEAGK